MIVKLGSPASLSILANSNGVLKVLNFFWVKLQTRMAESSKPPASIVESSLNSTTFNLKKMIEEIILQIKKYYGDG